MDLRQRIVLKRTGSEGRTACQPSVLDPASQLASERRLSAIALGSASPADHSLPRTSALNAYASEAFRRTERTLRSGAAAAPVDCVGKG